MGWNRNDRALRQSTRITLISRIRVAIDISGGYTSADQYECRHKRDDRSRITFDRVHLNAAFCELPLARSQPDRSSPGSLTWMMNEMAMLAN
jgi:hypothetical protein